LLRRHGIEVTVFATGAQWDPETIAGLQELGVKFRLPPALVRASRKLSALYCGLAWPFMVPRQSDSVYCISAGRSQLLMHRLKPAHALTINHEIVEPPGLQSPAGKCVAELDVTVANSRKVAQLMKEIWPEKPIRVIPFLTSDAPMPPPVGRRRVGADGLLRVVYLGRLVEQKRPDHLVRRWSKITRHPALAGARLDIRGYDPDGRMLKDLREFVMRTGTDDQVKIHGEYSLADLPRILEETDLVVLPSLWEGLPLVLVEAMLKGVPFVATAAGGTEELGENNPDVIVTSTDWADLEAGLIAMAGKIRSGAIDPLRLHAWAEDHYGYAAVSQQWLDCLCQPREFFNLP
jgi:glycosyltransferase involved in cell wall biosynthesis